MGLSNATIQSMWSHLLKESTWTAPAGIFVALSTTNPTASGAGATEVTGGSYARVSHSGAGTWILTPGTTNQFENNGSVAFAAATANWGTVTHFMLYDAITAGNFLGYGKLTVAKTISNTDTATFADAELKLSITDQAS